MTLPKFESSIRAAKAQIRAHALARRDALPAEARQTASDCIARRLLALVEGRRFAAVAGYLPIRSEVDSTVAMAALGARGAAIGVPAIVSGDLLFRQLEPGMAMEAQGFGTVAPGPDAPELQPEFLIVPLAAFDTQCGRCGYGRGYYDRAIARLCARGPLLTIGVAFDAQRVDAVPMEPHDRVLDMVVTESAVHRPSTGSGR